MRKLLHVSTVNIDTVDETIVGTKLTPRLLIPREPSYLEGESRHHFPGFHAIMARRDVEHVQIVDEFARPLARHSQESGLSTSIYSLMTGKNMITVTESRELQIGF